MLFGFNSFFKNKELFKARLELLQLLSSLVSIPLESVNHYRYYQKRQIDQIKAIKEFLCNDLQKRYTLSEIAIKYNISLTALKECFKAVYGMPLSLYMRNYRIDTATKLLDQTNYSISEIAEMIGYANPSKFSEAFKQIMKMTPQQYRNSF